MRLGLFLILSTFVFASTAQALPRIDGKRTVPHRVSLRAFAGPCLSKIIDREGSGWNPRKWNSQGSGAYGLPQALPGSKMASAGKDWATNAYTQIRWMRGYVNGRYGSCEAALAFHYRNGWY